MTTKVNATEKSKKDEPKVFEARTIKSIFFKYLLETIKGYINDLNFVFTPEGIRITKRDGSAVSEELGGMWITYAFLGAENFEYFFSKNKYIIGIEVSEFYKLIKNVNVKDSITLSLDSESPRFLCITLENSSQGKIKRYYLPVLFLDDKPFKLGDVQSDHCISLPSKTFQEIIKEMSGFGSDRIEIISYNNQLVFTNYGEKTKLSSEITLRQMDPVEHEIVDDNVKRITYTQSSDTIIKGDFSLHYLNYFIKATSMSPYMKIYMENDKPLILEWNIGDLGVFRVVLMIKEKATS